MPVDGANQPSRASYPRADASLAALLTNKLNPLRPRTPAETKTYPSPPKPPAYSDLPRRGGGRSAGDRTGGGGGRAGSVRRPVSRGPSGRFVGTTRSRWGLGRGGSGGGSPWGPNDDTPQARAEIARAVRRQSQGAARRRPPSERVKNPRPEGFRPKAARSARVLSKRSTPKTIIRAWPGRSAASPPRRFFRRGHALARVPMTPRDVWGHAQGHVPVRIQTSPREGDLSWPSTKRPPSPLTPSRP